jgi:ECF transporter S component (folate family)
MSILQKFRDSSRELRNVRTLAVCAMMLALRVILGMFSNFTLAVVPFVKIGFSFIPVVIVAYLFGPVCAAIVSGAGDILSIILANPTAFSITPGITVCCIIEGLIYGVVLYQSELKLNTVIIAKAAVLILCHLPLNTLVLSFLMGVPYLTLLLYRAAVLIPFAVVEVLIIMLISKLLIRVKGTLKK